MKRRVMQAFGALGSAVALAPTTAWSSRAPQSPCFVAGAPVSPRGSQSAAADNGRGPDLAPGQVLGR